MKEKYFTKSFILKIKKFNTFELIAICFVLINIIILGFGSLIFTESIWNQYVYPNIWEPIVNDATVGDSGYNTHNTILFAVLLFAFVISFSGIFRIFNLPVRYDSIIAFIPWVILAATIRVLEDAEFFKENIDILFISPVIHFHLAIWLIFSGSIGIVATKNLTDKSNNEIFSRMINRIRFCTLFMLLLFYLIIFEPSLVNHSNLTWFSIPITIIVSVAVAWFSPSIPKLSWSPLERMLFSTGNTFCILTLGFWFQFLIEPWGTNSSQEFWPIVVSLGIPSITVILLYRFGIDAQIELEKRGLEPGVLEEKWTVSEWEKHESDEKNDIERLMSKAMIASPLTLAFTFGQLCDGLATWIGIDFGNYTEKHILGTKIMEIGSTIIEGDGAWLFLIVKIILTGVLILVFSKVRIEQNQKHLRLLIVLALLAVGLAPGLRNLGRNVLGV
ncbi:MAG: hypothetical protein CMB56_005170 [Methanobacteriota archaeon]|nr:MAG: hypothetical protein CMB56_005170 [Euryarchaeota archaeon]|tara:strand:+ start:12582 stop:13916 length:1335 start_codon:yes stop_codon:yes gene_type:complete